MPKTTTTTALSLSLSLVDRMAAEGLSPNLVTFNTLVDAHARRGRWRGCLLLLLPGGVDFSGGGSGENLNFGLNCRCKLNSLNSSAVERAGVRPEARKLNEALSAAAKGVALEEEQEEEESESEHASEKENDEGRKRRIRKLSAVDAATLLFLGMLCLGLSPTPATYSSFITGFGRAGLKMPCGLSRTPAPEAARGRQWSLRRSRRRSSGTA